MAQYAPPVLKARRAQMYFRLSEDEVARLRRFGEPRRFAAGDYLMHSGDVGFGMAVVLSGRVEVIRRDGLGADAASNRFGPRSFVGEVASLAGRASFVDLRAVTSVEALMLPPAGLRAAVTAEAELGERIMRALILRRVGLIESGAGGPVVIGAPGHPDILRLQNFLGRNGVPYRALDPDGDQDAHASLASVQASPDELPLVVLADGTVLRNPSEHELAARVGLLPALPGDKVYDVAVVGAGPAGLAVAVYGASEGLSVAVLEARAIGGQAGASMRIENYLGFPTGVTGQALAGRAFAQAQKFGADVAIASPVRKLDCAGAAFALETAAGERLKAKAVVIASGADYRRPGFPGLAEAELDGAHYWASPLEARLCAGQEVVLVGGGNSAGQAAVYLADHVAKVWMLVRGPGLADTMSRYLIDRIAAHPNIALLTHTEIERLEVDATGALAKVDWRNKATGEATERPIRHVFLFIGADPCTGWLAGCGAKTDDRGFLLTGSDARPEAHNPPSLMTSVDGLFAIGDVRSGSTKRVAAAVGEGAAVVAQIHAWLAGRAATPAAKEDVVA